MTTKTVKKVVKPATPKTNIEMFVDEVRSLVEEYNQKYYVGAAYNGALAGGFAVSADTASSVLARTFGAPLNEILSKFQLELKTLRYEVDTKECFYTVKHKHMDETQEVKIA